MNLNDRVGIRQNIYTSGFFRTQKFTPKVRDSRQIQCYQKGVIRDKFNAKKNKKTSFMLKNASKLQQRWKKVKICTSCF